MINNSSVVGISNYETGGDDWGVTGSSPDFNGTNYLYVRAPALGGTDPGPSDDYATLGSLTTSNGLSTDGGRFVLDNGGFSSGSRTSYADLSSYATSPEYWFSGIISASGPTTATGYVFWLDEDGVVGLSWRIGFKGTDLVARARDSGFGEEIVLVSNYTAGTDYFFIAKGEVDTIATFNDELSIWINPADISSEGALGATTGTFSASIAPFSNGSSNAIDRLELSSGDINTGAIFEADEIRFGTTFESVAPIPEPSALALVGIAGIAVAVFRRRKR